MIDLYTAATPNGHTAAIMLEELGAQYVVYRIDLSKGEQRRPEYLHINPTGRVPTIIDHDADDFAVFESGAILVYLAEKYGKFLPPAPKGRSVVIQWLMLQIGGIGPVQGHMHMFARCGHEKYQPALVRFQDKARHLYAVLEHRLNGRSYLCNDYSIADIAGFPWVNAHAWSGIAMDGLPNLSGWLERIRARPAVLRGLAVPPCINPVDTVDGPSLNITYQGPPPTLP